jgi:hypothetical protein
MTRKIALAFGCLVMVVAPAVAQAPPTSPSGTTAPTQAECPPGSHVNPPGMASPGGTIGQNREPLGEKLARTDGVLCPPTGVDPEIRVPAPDTGTLRVIPPPGSPGGDQSVQPK